MSPYLLRRLSACGHAQAGRRNPKSPKKLPWTAVLGILKKLARDGLTCLLEILFPSKCFKCGSSLTGLENRSICPSCLNQINLIKPPFCNICGMPFYFQYNIPNENNYSCGTCRTETHYFNKARSLGKYEGILREALINYKYRGRMELLKDLMKKYFEAQNRNGLINLEPPDFILYVPLHKKKLRARGFDQAYLIAKEISKISNIPLKTDLLFRKKDTASQAGLKKQVRKKNLKNAFAVRNENLLEGKNILLVDDVFTTGTTVNECSKVLKQNGAGKVEVFTLARAV